MTKEEAIKRIKDHIRVHKIGDYPHIYLREALDMAIEALEKQIPKKAKTTPYLYKNNVYKHYCCPACNYLLGWEYTREKTYCRNCGQALDWEWEPEEQDKAVYEVNV